MVTTIYRLDCVFTSFLSVSAEPSSKNLAVQKHAFIVQTLSPSFSPRSFLFHRQAQKAYCSLAGPKDVKRATRATKGNYAHYDRPQPERRHTLPTLDYRISVWRSFNVDHFRAYGRRRFVLLSITMKLKLKSKFALRSTTVWQKHFVFLLHTMISSRCTRTTCTCPCTPRILELLVKS